MKVISVINRKGGVGKTVTTQALGAGLIANGYKVLYIDLDSQTNLSFALGVQDTEQSIFDVLTGDTPIKKAIIKTEQGDIIPASESLSTADALIDGTGKEYRLKEALEGLKYDYVVIDTPAYLGTLTVNALTASNGCIIPVQAEIYSLQGIDLLNKTINAVKRYCNPGLSIKGILITRYNKRATISKDMQGNLEEIAKILKTKVYSVPIRECIAVKEAQASQQDIFTYAGKSNAAEDYRAFIKEFLKDEKKKAGPQ